MRVYNDALCCSCTWSGLYYPHGGRSLINEGCHYLSTQLGEYIESELRYLNGG